MLAARVYHTKTRVRTEDDSWSLARVIFGKRDQCPRSSGNSAFSIIRRVTPPNQFCSRRECP